MPTLLNPQQIVLPEPFATKWQALLKEWDLRHNTMRLWDEDASLWTGDEEDRWLGWLGVIGEELSLLSQIERLAIDVRGSGFSDVLLLGMGGSSLCPEVLAQTFGRLPGLPRLRVLDSTDPAQVREARQGINITKTLFVVASKSGSTLEPNVFLKYFLAEAEKKLGVGAAGKFVAITDPGSALEKRAKSDGFRYIFHGVPTIGGRYAALSHFGMAPAAAMGVNVQRFLESADEMAAACHLEEAAENPGVALGLALGLLGKEGRDKITFIASEPIEPLGAWLEQLIAESTGKQGKALLPIDREPLGQPPDYAADRVIVYLRFDPAASSDQDGLVEALQQAGHPVIRISLDDVYRLGQEFFRWEIATAAAGAVMKINPFNQPDVEASKVETRKLTEAYRESGSLPSEPALFEDGGIRLYADPANAEALGQHDSLESYLKAHLSRIGPGDYFALLAYLHMSEAHETPLQRLRAAVRDTKKAATCLGFGPRFLHSTGQAYKGGPNTGVFLQITCDDAEDLEIPGEGYSFGVVKAAQAAGDFAVLNQRGRRALRVHLPARVKAGLARLESAILQALQ